MFHQPDKYLTLCIPKGKSIISQTFCSFVYVCLVAWNVSDFIWNEPVTVLNLFYCEKKKKKTGSKFLIKTNLEKITNLSACYILGLSWVLKSFTISCDPFCLRKQNISFMSSLALLVHHLIWIRMTSMHSTVGIMNHKLTQWETLPQYFTAVPQVWILHLLLLTLLQLWM